MRYVFECLECRRLFAGSIEVVAGTLVVTGTNKPDDIQVELTAALRPGHGGSTIVTMNGGTVIFPQQFKQIEIWGKNGNDQLSFESLGPYVFEDGFTADSLKVSILGGNGHDRIVAKSDRPLFVDGGKGKNVVSIEFALNSIGGRLANDLFH